MLSKRPGAPFQGRCYLKGVRRRKTNTDQLNILCMQNVDFLVKHLYQKVVCDSVGMSTFPHISVSFQCMGLAFLGVPGAHGDGSYSKYNNSPGVGDITN